MLNVRLFIRQAEAFSRFIHGYGTDSTFTAIMDDTETALAVAQCMATITYAQLIAENATLFNVAPEMISSDLPFAGRRFERVSADTGECTPVGYTAPGAGQEIDRSAKNNGAGMGIRF